MLPIDPGLYVASRHIVSGPLLPVFEPWTGKKLADVVCADAATAEEAIVAAVRASEQLARLTSYERKRICRSIADALEQNIDHLAELIAREAGKPLALARVEVLRAVSTFEIASEEATRIGGEVIPLDITASSGGYRGEYTRVPAGPVLGISPFNFPLNLVAHKVAPALACGAAIVLKPAPQAPLTSLFLAELVRKSGAPESALQVVPCDNVVAERLVRDDRFATLSFTGSANVGFHLKSIAGKKRVLLELGGNATTLVHEDAQLDFAAERVTFGAFGYAGQVCIKVQRLYVHAPIAERFIADLVARARAIVPTDPLDPKALVGPMIDENNARRVGAWLDEAAGAGAQVLAGGRPEGPRVPPTIVRIEGSGRGLKIVDEEVFGPVLTVHRYERWEDALAMADDSRYGLQAGIFTDSHTRIRQAFERLHVGGLIVNDVPTFRVDSMPYGGVRDSGLGREGVRFAIEEMTERKLIVYREAR
ncbi:aldehyde dehydrogenase family protein [Pendulispora albinea]|uniref:Aldehyde dehydrogenase family protein n=1 Tax=Pendulispora albinea TaxID=2741071 RepID=A0ABZ2LWW6_9BACT